LKILVIGAAPRSLINFRGALLEKIVERGHEVAASASGEVPIVTATLKDMGIRYHPIRLERAGMNPIKDIKTLLDMIRMIYRLEPDIVLSYTIKPVIYGGLSAPLCGVKAYYSLISGLGYIFTESRSLRKYFLGSMIRMLYRLSLKRSRKVFFQNPDDQALFLRKGLVQSTQAVLIKGSGVDIGHYGISPLPDEPVFLMIARLLADKGVREYVEAADKVKKRLPQTRFLLVGGLDPNPNAIRESELKKWQEAGIIEYLGYLDDVRHAIQMCRCYVLPSYYREGLPRSVLEAMSMGRPVITTDAAGCRETVILTREGQRQREQGDGVMRGENGYLVRTRDVVALANAMLQILEEPAMAKSMAIRGREIAEEIFDVHKVNKVLLKEMGLL
jgi:glycosyltransferase involved in cell wall biosynthesis